MMGINEGLAAIKESLYGPEPSSSILESGLEAIRECLYGANYNPMNAGLNEISDILGEGV